MDFLDFDPEDKTFKEPATWTIITALNRVLSQSRKSSLSEEFWKSIRNPLTFLNKELGLTDIQIVILAILIEEGQAVSWRGFGSFLGCSRLSMMVYSEEIEELVKKRWLARKGAYEMDGCYEGFALEPGVITAMRHNQTFVPEKIDGLNEQQFIEKIENHIANNIQDNNKAFKDDEEWLYQIVSANPHLPCARRF